MYDVQHKKNINSLKKKVLNEETRIVGPVFALRVRNCLPTGDLQAENLEFC